MDGLMYKHKNYGVDADNLHIAPYMQHPIISVVTMIFSVPCYSTLFFFNIKTHKIIIGLYPRLPCLHLSEVALPQYTLKIF